MNIVDLCSAPGGKTAQLASSGKKVISVDINQKRVEHLKENMKRLDLQTNVVIADGTLWEPNCDIDAVLLDAPCSATGTIRRHPDILKNRTKENLNSYIEIQSKLIKQSLSWLNKNGILIYSVCSLQKEEGENQIYSILNNFKDIKISPILPKEVSKFEHAITKEGWLRIFPNCLGSDGGNDGFFIQYFVGKLRCLPTFTNCYQNLFKNFPIRLPSSVMNGGFGPMGNLKSKPQDMQTG